MSSVSQVCQSQVRLWLTGKVIELDLRSSDIQTIDLKASLIPKQKTNLIRVWGPDPALYVGNQF